MKKQIHIVYFITLTAVGILIGSALALIPAMQPFARYHWLIVSSVLAVLVVAKRYRWMLGLALIVGVLLGLWRGASVQLEFTKYKNFYGENVHISGHVARDIARKNNGITGVQLSKVKVDNFALQGDVWVSLTEKNEIKRGDNIAVEGKMNDGFGNFPASITRAKLIKIEKTKHADIGREIRDWFSGKVSLTMPKEQASLGLSYLVGQQQMLSEDFSNELKMLGLIHLAVASGYHLSLIVRYIKRPLSGISKYLAFMASVFFIVGFLLISGFGTSMIRAGIMTALSLLAWYYGRRIHPIVLIIFTASITALANPAYVWGDVGWYLSFMAFAGIAILAPLIHQYFWGNKKEPGILRHLLVGTVSAQILTLPIIVFTFGEYSPLALVSNILIQPFVPLTMLLTFIGGIATVIVPSMAQLVGWPANALLTYMIKISNWLASSPWADGELKFSPSQLIMSFVFILGLSVFLWRKTKINFKQENVLN